LFAEVITLRKDVEHKENELERFQFKQSQLEKQIVFAKKQSQQAQIMNKMPMISNLVMPF